MSFGKTSSTSNPVLTQEQRDQIAAQTGMLTGTIIPSYTGAVQGAKEVYDRNAQGILNAAQNQAGVARQAQESLGATGESALRTGISGLQSLFSPDYEAQQIAAALQPAQAQYQQNLAGQQAMFGGTGNLGSARQALAERQLAGSTMATQAQTAAQVASNIAAQRANVGSTLASLGQGGIGQALGAAGNAVSAANIPIETYNKYASVIFGTPAASYQTDFRGTQGTTKTGTEIGISNPFKFL